MFGFFIFNAIRRVTSEQTAGQVADFIMRRVPRNRLTYRVTDVASYWLNAETAFRPCQHCFDFVIKAKDPYIHDECEAPFIEDHKRSDEEERQADEEWQREQEQHRQEELDWEKSQAEEEAAMAAYYAELERQEEEERLAAEEASYPDEPEDDVCERCGLKSCPGPCDQCGECVTCVCHEMASLRRYNATPLEDRCGPWTA